MVLVYPTDMAQKMAQSEALLKKSAVRSIRRVLLASSSLKTVQLEEQPKVQQKHLKERSPAPLMLRE